MKKRSITYWILGAGGLATAITAVTVLYAQAEPVLSSLKSAPWAGQVYVAQLEQTTRDAVDALKTQALSSATAWCEHYRKLAAEAQARVNATNALDAKAIAERDWNGAQRDFWCAEATKGR